MNLSAFIQPRKEAVMPYRKVNTLLKGITTKVEIIERVSDLRDRN